MIWTFFYSFHNLALNVFVSSVCAIDSLPIFLMSSMEQVAYRGCVIHGRTFDPFLILSCNQDFFS